TPYNATTVRILLDLLQSPICLTTTIYYLLFYNHTATTKIYTLSLHDALPISSLSKQALCFPFLALGCDCGNRSSDRKCIIVQYVLSSHLRARINDHRRLQI